ncbi:MAG: DcaP family trimeric outer membrane transporter [Pseudomonadales bacterium]
MTNRTFRRKLARSYISPLVLLTIPCTAWSATNTELEERIRQLEAIVQQLGGQVTQQEETLETIKVVKDEEKAEVGATKLQSGMGAGTTVTFGGYVKTDAIYSDYSDGDLAAGSNGRDFYIPSTIPVGGEDEDPDLDMHAKESRFFLKTDTDIGGSKLTSYFEMDFLLPPGGNERVSNSYNPRLRHAFIKYDGWLLGQTWSTFQDVGALAENLDFVGPAEGTVFERQPQIRYTQGPWQLALENPESTITPFGGGDRIVTDDNGLPDIVVRYTHTQDWGWLTAAALARQLSVEDSATNIDDDETSFGISVSGKILFGKDDLRFMVTGGTGLGRYVGLNVANGAVLDANGDLEAIDSLSGFVSYRHFWSEQWRSNLTLSTFSADNDDDLTGGGATKEAQSVHVNLLFSPNPKFTVGVEYMIATRENEAGDDGDLNRLQFSGKYAF